MTSMTDILKKKPSQLVDFVNEKREEIRQTRFAVAGSAARDVKKMRTAKKDIARALTALNNTRA